MLSSKYYRQTVTMTGFECENQACIDGYYTCGRHKKELDRRAWLRMTEKQKEYDRYVDPMGAYTSGYSAGADECCSCHINPPCSYCVNKEQESEANAE